jgi:beta-glucosidase/6-phospho-beta-glucosidase/beta-galactosidase
MCTLHVQCSGHAACAAIDYQGKKPGLDWWGVNYYARGVVSPYFTPVQPPAELMTDMKYSLYPLGLYHCFVRGSQLGVPMYVTEIGCADKSPDDKVRVAHVDSFTSQARFHMLSVTTACTPGELRNSFLCSQPHAFCFAYRVGCSGCCSCVLLV